MRNNFTIAVLAAASLAIQACSLSDEAPKPAKDNLTGLVISNARLMLPPVKGNPAAVYFDLKNEGTRAVAVRSADIADAKTASLHGMMEYGGKMTMSDMGPTTIAKGATMKFEPGGNHVMAFDLSPEMTPGAKTELTLTIAGGDKVSADVQVMAAGADR